MTYDVYQRNGRWLVVYKDRWFEAETREMGHLLPSRGSINWLVHNGIVILDFSLLLIYRSIIMRVITKLFSNIPAPVPIFSTSTQKKLAILQHRYSQAYRSLPSSQSRIFHRTPSRTVVSGIDFGPKLLVFNILDYRALVTHRPGQGGKTRPDSRQSIEDHIASRCAVSLLVP